MTTPASRRLVIVVAVVLAVAWWAWPGDHAPRFDEVTVAAGPLSVRVIESGTLRPGRAVTYRSPLEGREVEVTFLAPEGLQVQPGDLIVRLEPSPLRRELERTQQALAQAQLELRVIEDDLAALNAATKLGEGGEVSIDVEEAELALRLAERQLELARREVTDLTPLLASGYITRDELDRAVLDAEQRQATARLAARRLDTLRNQVEPQNRQKAMLDAAQQSARRGFSADRVRDLELQVAAFREAIDACTIYADAAGLVVYEENLGANPRRRVRVGDRVTPSQGLITIPEIDRMVVETSVREGDVRQVSPGMPATIRPEAFPDQVLDGTVEFIGTLARGPMDRPFDDRRYDVRIAVAPSPLSLRPGMTARVEIRVADRASVTLLPVTAVFERDGHRVAHVRRGSDVESRMLELGLFDGSYFEVLSGVTPGDRVLLIDRAGQESPRP